MNPPNLSPLIRRMNSSAEVQELTGAIDPERSDRLVISFAKLFERRSQLQTAPSLAHLCEASASFPDTSISCDVKDLRALKNKDSRVAGPGAAACKE